MVKLIKISLGANNPFLFILAVTIERYLVVRSPLYSRIYWDNKKRFITLATIFLMTFLLTFYHHFEFECKLINFCNFTEVQIFCYSVTGVHSQKLLNTSNFRLYYIQISTIGNILLIVFIPIVAVASLTVLLIRQLHVNDLIVLTQSDSSNHRRTINTQQVGFRRMFVVNIKEF